MRGSLVFQVNFASTPRMSEERGRQACSRHGDSPNPSEFREERVLVRWTLRLMRNDPFFLATRSWHHCSLPRHVRLVRCSIVRGCEMLSSACSDVSLGWDRMAFAMRRRRNPRGQDRTESTPFADGVVSTTVTCVPAISKRCNGRGCRCGPEETCCCNGKGGACGGLPSEELRGDATCRFLGASDVPRGQDGWIGGDPGTSSGSLGPTNRRFGYQLGKTL